MMAAGLSTLLPMALTGSAGGILLLAAIHDLRRFEIPDILSILLALLAVVHMATLPELSLLGAFSHLGSGAIVFALGAGLFTIGAMGGGDVKLMSALALWTGLSGLPQLLGPILLSGGVLALVLLVARRAAPAFCPAPGRLPRLLAADAPLPYAVAILAGAAIWSGTTLL